MSATNRRYFLRTPLNSSYTSFPLSDEKPIQKCEERPAGEVLW